MKNKKTLLTITGLFVLVVGGAAILYNLLGKDVAANQLAGQPASQSQTQEQEPAQKISAPDFTVYDIDGNPVRLSDFVGKPVVINYWASWCGSCHYEMPDFQEKYLELEDEVHFLMVNMTSDPRETIDSAADYVADNGYTFPVYYDTEASAAYAYNVYTLPSTFFIDAQGNPAAHAIGPINADMIQQGIDMCL